MARRAGAICLLALLLAGAGVPAARAANTTDLAAQYRQAAISHDRTLAARVRVEASLLAEAQPSPARSHLVTVLAATRDALHPWPLADRVDRLVGAIDVARVPVPARPYAAVRNQLSLLTTAQASGNRRAAVAAGLRAYEETARLRTRLGTGATGLDNAFWSVAPGRPGVLEALARREPARRVASAADRVRSDLSLAEQTLGDVRVSRATVVTDAAILVFREGLEAVLILAAITASFVGARRHLRRPVLLGGIAGIGATAVTWALVQLLVSELGTGGLRLEAVTGLLAIAVLLVVTNWFFHRVYWSQWIARFNRRRKSLERFDRVGFVSGQVLTLAVLGLTSVYREGFETVLFLQNLQVSAGTSACLLGAAIGLSGTLVVGTVTFVLQRKLPYKRMLIATGVLIALVLAVMTGTTAHVMQGLGWLPTTPASFTVPVWMNSWFGIYATWEGIGAQLGALVVVVGSYVVAREVQVRGPQRRARRQEVRDLVLPTPPR